MSTNLRLSPSGPLLGPISLMPLREAQDVAQLAAALVLDGTAQDVNPLLRATLLGPFNATHYLSAECELDVSNASADTLAQITIAIQVSVDGGAFVTVHSEIHGLGANPPGEGDPARVVQPIRCHVTPRILADWDSPPFDAEEITVQVVATLTDGEATEVVVEADSLQWLRLTEHSPPSPSPILRLSPSGPPVGGIGAMPLRMDETVTSLRPNPPFTLTGALLEPVPDLTVQLDSPNPGHLYSAEAELDISNDSSAALAVVTLALQASNQTDAWVTVQTATHNIGANAAGDERQIRNCAIHLPPLDFGILLGLNPAHLKLRLQASMTGPGAGAVEVETADCFMRLVEHTTNPSEQTQIRLSPSGPVLGGVGLMALRVVEDLSTLEAAFELPDATPEDVDAGLRATLAGPFDLTHYWSAEAELDVSNTDSNNLAEVTLLFSVQLNGTGPWHPLHTETHFIGAIAGGGEQHSRQVRPICLHMPPLSAADTAWSGGAPLPAGTTSMTIRVEAFSAVESQVEANPAWIRLTEHSAP